MPRGSRESEGHERGARGCYRRASGTAECCVSRLPDSERREGRAYQRQRGSKLARGDQQLSPNSCKILNPMTSRCWVGDGSGGRRRAGGDGDVVWWKCSAKERLVGAFVVVVVVGRRRKGP